MPTFRNFRLSLVLVVLTLSLYSPVSAGHPRNNEDEQIYSASNPPVEFDLMETLECSTSNFVVIVDHEPIGGSLGPEDEQWFVDDSGVYVDGENGTLASHEDAARAMEIYANCPCQ